MAAMKRERRDLFFYWKEKHYHRDRAAGLAYNLNSASDLLTACRPGDVVWAGSFWAGRFRLLARLEVAAVVGNPPGYRYGPYRVWGSARAGTSTPSTKPTT